MCEKKSRHLDRPGGRKFLAFRPSISFSQATWSGCCRMASHDIAPSLLGHKQRNDFTFGDLQKRKIHNFFSEIIAVPEKGVCDRHSFAILHESYVSLDCPGCRPSSLAIQACSGNRLSSYPPDDSVHPSLEGRAQGSDLFLTFFSRDSGCLSAHRNLPLNDIKSAFFCGLQKEAKSTL